MTWGPIIPAHMSGLLSHRAGRLFSLAGALLFGSALAICGWRWSGAMGAPSTGPLLRPVLVNLALFTLFAGHHSLFARTPLRALIARWLPPPCERSAFVWMASLLLITVCLAWQPVPGIAWTVSAPLAWAGRALQGAGIWLTLRGAAAVDVWELAGVKPAATNRGPVIYSQKGPYGWVRHPIYAGWLLLTFAEPVMTGTRLAFAVISTAYLLVGIPLEERTLRAAGPAYGAYASVVRWRLIPGLY